MAKEMPASDEFGNAQVLYEITASGIDQEYVENIDNSNRLRERTSDSEGNGIFDMECDFPFSYNNITYSDCTEVDNNGIAWCSTKVNSNGVHVTGFWGNCLSKEKELKQTTLFSDHNTCSGSKHHVCSSRSNYGTIEVDWKASTVAMNIWTPHEEAQNVLASSHTIAF